MGKTNNYSKGNKCLDCGVGILNASIKCRGCSNKLNIGIPRSEELRDKISKAKRMKFSKEQVEEMKDMYVNKRICTLKISKHFKCSENPISRILKENNVMMRTNPESKIRNKGSRYGRKNSRETRRKISESNRGRTAHNKISFNGKQTKAIISFYNNELLSTINIGKKFDVSAPVIRHILAENGQYMNQGERRKLLFSKNKIERYWEGKSISNEAKKKMSDFRKGKTYEELLGKEKSDKLKEKLSIAHSGSKCTFWRGGISYEPYDKSFNNRFKRAIRKRDNQICMVCQTHREKLKRALDVHHVDYNKLNTFQQNCISLCQSCHPKTQINREYWTHFFQSLLSDKYGYEYSKENEIILNIGEMQNG